MLKDFTEFPDGKDWPFEQNEAPRAANILSVQLEALSFNPTFGIDLGYFLESTFAIQNSSFKGYCAQRLLDYQINLISIVDTVNRFDVTSVYGIGVTMQSGGLIQ